LEIFSNNAFNHKSAIIIGGAGDIGAEIAIQFSKVGTHKIALLDKDTSGLNKVARQLKNTTSQVLQIEVDLADENSIQQAVKNLYADFKDWNVLVTTAGVFKGGTLIDLKADDWDKLMAINARAIFLSSRLIAEKMIAIGGGKIIHVGSSSTYYGTPGSGAYAASKVVINQLTQTMAVEWGSHNIQVNTICPTVTETKFLEFVTGDILHEQFRERLKQRMPLKRLLKPSDIAPTVLFLASDGSQFINGAIIPIDGGARLVST